MHSLSPLAPNPAAVKSCGLLVTRLATGDNADAQDAYDALPPNEQAMCTWLQEFTRDIMLYNSNRILSPGSIIAIKRDLHEKRATGGIYEWGDWLALSCAAI